MAVILYQNVFSSPHSASGLIAEGPFWATPEQAVEEAREDAERYEYTVVHTDHCLGAFRGRVQVCVIDLTPQIRELEAEAAADARHNRGLAAGAGRAVL